MLIGNAHLDGNELRDQVIVVTGAGQGIGKAHGNGHTTAGRASCITIGGRFVIM